MKNILYGVNLMYDTRVWTEFCDGKPFDEIFTPGDVFFKIEYDGSFAIYTITQTKPGVHAFLMDEIDFWPNENYKIGFYRIQFHRNIKSEGDKVINMEDFDRISATQDSRKIAIIKALFDQTIMRQEHDHEGII
jgi:hypothetical protein